MKKDLKQDFKIEAGVLLSYWGKDVVIHIPNSVTKIGDNAFDTSSYCIEIPPSVSNVESYLNNITLPNNKNFTQITIPNSVTDIGAGAFKGCTSLTQIDIPNSVINIGDRAFEGCTSLTQITIPESVTSIGDSAFEGCTNLK